VEFLGLWGAVGRQGQTWRPWNPPREASRLCNKERVLRMPGNLGDLRHCTDGSDSRRRAERGESRRKCGRQRSHSMDGGNRHSLDGPFGESRWGLPQASRCPSMLSSSYSSAYETRKNPRIWTWPLWMYTLLPFTRPFKVRPSLSLSSSLVPKAPP
jgi:hypothetical protein